MKKQLSLLFCFFLTACIAFGQSRIVSGIVTNASDGKAIESASVVLKELPNVGTSTDVQGRFTLKVSQKAKSVVVSILGYTSQTLVIPSNGSLNVKLEPTDQQLGEVVVTAFGIKRDKNSLGYSVQTVSADALEKANQTDALKALSGKVAGVQITGSTGTPGGSSYIQLRGQNSITGNNQPLFVIDGVPIDNSQNYSGNPSDAQNNLLAGAANTNRASDINPNDIANISILKGPAAAALYGIGAANGAIIITTKTGSPGKVQIELNTGMSFDQVNRYPGLQNQWSKGSKGQIGKYPSSDRYSWGPKIDTLMRTGIPTDFDQNGEVVGRSDARAKAPFVPYDNMRSFFRVAPSYTNSISIAGGSDKVTYRMGYSNLYQNSIVPTQFYQRDNVSFSGGLKISDKLKASSSINYTRSNSSQPQNGSNTSGIMLGLTRTPIDFDNTNGATSATDSKAYLFPVNSAYGGLQRAYRFNGEQAIYDNPFWTLNKTPYTTNLNRLIGNIQLDYTIGSGFSALYRLGTDVYQDNRHQYYDIGSSAYLGGRIFDDRYTYTSLNSDLILNYTKQISDKLKFDGKIGQNIYSTRSDQLYSQGDALVTSDFDNINNATNFKPYNSIVPYRRTSVYADFNLDYASTLFLELTGRNDWSSTLPKGKNSFFYPSASLGFVFTQLGDLKESKILSYGKLRASIAQVGKDAGAFALTNTYTTTNFADGYTDGLSYPNNGISSYSRFNVLGNPDLRPEKTISYELGLNLQFLQNRLGVDVTGYYTKGQDLIVSAPISSVSGYNAQVINSGSIQTKGLELQLTGTPIKSKDFIWESFVNFSSYKNKVLKLAEGVDQITLNGFTGTTIAQIAGYPAASIFGYGYTRDNNGNILIDDNPGNNNNYPVAAAVQKFLGSTIPKFLLGFGNTFSYKNFSLYGLIDWKHGGKMWNGTRGSLAAIGTSDLTNNRGDMHVFQGVLGHLNAAGEIVHFNAQGSEVAGPGAVNSVPVALDENWYKGNGGGFGNLNEAFIEDASFVKLRELSLSYDFSSFFKDSKFIKGINVGTFVRNVIIWTPYKGIDPETSLTGATSAQGIDYFNMPGTATYGFNIKFKF